MIEKKADDSESNSDSDYSSDADATVHKSKNKEKCKKKLHKLSALEEFNILEIEYLPCVKGMVTNTQWFSITSELIIA